MPSAQLACPSPGACRYANVAKTYNEQLYSLTLLYMQREQAQAQLANLQQQIAGTKESLTQNSSPNSVETLNTMEEVYRSLQFSVIRALWELNQAVSFATLKPAPLSVPSDPTYALLLELYSQIQENVLSSINVSEGPASKLSFMRRACFPGHAFLALCCFQEMENLQPWTADTPVVSLRRQDVPASTWEKALRQGDLTFQVAPCDISQ